FTPVDLIINKTFSPEMLAYLWLCVENNKSLLFVGGTASGKTSSLNAVSLFIPPFSKVITIEDTRELMLHHENWIADVTRDSFLGERGTIDMYELLRHALRQRPEYLIVGEVRGKEALTLFQAMSTGHTTYSTMHASSIQEVVNRLQNDPINVPLMMLSALNILSIQILTHVRGERVRRTQLMVEITGIEPTTNNIRINETFRWNPVSDTFEKLSDSQILEDIRVNRGWSPPELREELTKREMVLKYMVKKNIRDYKSVSSMIQAYSLNPNKVLKEIGEI
ncbi:MAG: type II/IV secretion system ATPase subunit, partial [Candidatus Syntropharchaeia archaeon]